MLAAQATSIVLLFLCVNRKKLKCCHLIGAFAAVVIIYILTHGRTSLILGSGAVILIAFHKRRDLNRMIFAVLPWTYVVIIVTLAICMVIYSSFETPFADFLNDTLFNGRIGLAYRSLLAYPVTIFGKTIDTSVWNQWQYFSLDNGQVLILLEYGIAGFLCYFWIIQKILFQIKKEKEAVFAIIMIVFLIWSMYEATMYFIGKNFALLFLGTVEQDKENSLKRVKKI